MRIALFLSAWLVCLGALAVPNEPATLDRSTWPESLTSPALFDVASRAEILTFSRALLSSEILDENALKQRLGLKTINLEAIEAVRKRMWQRLLANYKLAQQSCDQDASFCYYINDLDSLRKQAGKFEITDDSFYAAWAQPSRMFHQRYLDEQLRLAALFPQISSEIGFFSEQEFSGEGMNDRLFMLTFDSGPSALPGTTDWLTDYLRTQSMSATFFVLGSALASPARQGQPAGGTGAVQGAMRGGARLGVSFAQSLARLAGLDFAQLGARQAGIGAALCTVVSPALRAATGRQRGVFPGAGAAGGAVGH